MAVQISGNDITVPRDGTFSRNVSIAGTLTYEDVTNVDSIGLVTARNGIEVGASPGVAASISVDGNAIFSGITTIGGNVKVGTGVTLSPDGDAFFTGVTTATTFVGNLTGNPTGSGANLTNLPAANLTGTLPAIDGSNLTGVSSPAANRNFIINGAMRFWQRGTTFNSQGNGQNDYTTDRFAIGHNNSHMAAVTQQDGTGADDKFQYCARVQRDSGNSQTDQMRFHTALETNDVILLRGETLTISYYARKGANYSEANSQISGVRIATGENTDGDPNAYSGGSWTNASTILTGTPTLTTSWQRFSHTTSAVSSSANSMIIEFRNTPVGTAGANDYYEITGVQLEIGSSATAFEHRKYSDELRSCQRYCFRLGGSLGGNAEVGTVLAMGVQSHSTSCKTHIQHPVTMRDEDITFTFADLTVDDDVSSYAAHRVESVQEVKSSATSSSLIFTTDTMGTVNATRVLVDSAGGYIQGECEL